MTGTTGRVTNYADIDELMIQYGRTLPEGMEIVDMIRRDNNNEHIFRTMQTERQ